MRVMIDTNVLVSALLFPGSRVAAVMEHIAAHHTLVLASFVIEELRAVVARKFPQRTTAIEDLLEALCYEYVLTPRHLEDRLFDIRDAKDYPVLYTAMTNGVDILVTGDKDFTEVDVDQPEIMTPSQYAEAYM
ncbi:MAG: putative toxin-antitoxin system toxin component, PIN family [Clostridia bacterium]|nr:putative toxin-antitoxin system toxin component, PIN family [Clostridia bacterium]MBR1561559.1 putative toxin-antitoxin system toxin component, PIN family [Clostridia bacterium]